MQSRNTSNQFQEEAMKYGMNLHVRAVGQNETKMRLKHGVDQIHPCRLPCVLVLPNSDGLQPNSDGLQPIAKNRKGLHDNTGGATTLGPFLQVAQSMSRLSAMLLRSSMVC